MPTIESLFNGIGQLRNLISMSTISTTCTRHADGPHELTTDNTMSFYSPVPQKARSSTRRRKIPTITRPDVGSLYDIMHDHAGTSLYLPPICWNDNHTTLLGVRFAECDAIVTPVPAPRCSGSDALIPSQIATTLGRDLTTLLATDKSRWFLQTKAIKNIMSTLFPDTLSRAKTNTDLDLYFGNRVFKKSIRIPVLWQHPESFTGSFDSAITITNGSTLSREPSSLSCSPMMTSRQPLLAYVNRKQLKVIRANLFRVCPGPGTPESQGAPTVNAPVLSLQQLRSKVLIPGVEDQDAHYVSILLAMAQAHFYTDDGSRSSSQLSPRSGGKPIEDIPSQFCDVTVRLIVHSEDPADFVVYTAVVTKSFLERFAQPTKAPQADKNGQKADTGMKISYVHVPIWPILGLRERLAKAVGRDVAGDAAVYDATTGKIETWHTPEELAQIKRQQRQEDGLYQATRTLLSQGKKRRRSDRTDRNVLVEMVNSSFEESFEDNDDAVSCTGDDIPVLSPEAKRRCTRTVTNPLEVC
ncbi:hypothetical protein DL546_003413 [Coniochaeta pulveracea]|uniref:Uncharacterized protein n=1 Tax=Coniochaeta pulveracea TaxID=177199 RepID=A0A420Y0L4_9PEZI|nr:hypothetical protein DL546_003413 [Coniochaeta pulveracea]